MRRDVALIKKTDFNSSFLSCEKDCEKILRRLFIETQPFSDELKRLLVISNKDCLDNFDNPVYNKKIKEMSLAKLKQEGYVRLIPKIEFPEHEEVKAYIIISFDNFTRSYTNDQHRNCHVTFDILCHTDHWDLGNFRLRPLKIAGYIDALLNNAHLTGIGTFQFIGCNQMILNDELSGYSLTYHAVHGSDDRLEE